VSPQQQRVRFDSATEGFDPPFALVDLDAFDHNATELVRRAGGTPIRVASKSVRVRALLERVLAVPGYAGLMTYSLAEAMWLFAEGTCDDLLVGYPTTDRATLQKLAHDEAARAAITIMVDSVDHLDLVDDALGPGHPDIRVCLELDASWRPLNGSRKLHVGPLRSPVHTAAQATALTRRIIDRPGFKLVGIMAYEGQIAGIGDAPPGNPLRGIAVRWMQGKSAVELAERRAAVVSAVRALAPLEFVNGGGTGSLEGTAAETAVTEVAAGSGLLGPTLFDGYRSFQPRPAALFALPVVRRPGPNVATLFTGGYPASGPIGVDRLPSPYLPAGLKLTKLEAAGEVQTPVTGKAADRLRVGDRVWLRHAKAGELAERFREFHLIRGYGVERTVPTYRGEGQAFG
jgi:D-serine deaminase-like pyridoxal phosphate-dependent protein